MEAAPRRLTESEIQQALKTSLPGWSLDHGKLRREYQFENFVQAFGFMASVALLAESMNHHPDWSNSYNRVAVSLQTHSLGGISNLDVELARKMEELVQQV